jgi:hypothetical protein
MAFWSRWFGKKDAGPATEPLADGHVGPGDGGLLP